MRICLLLMDFIHKWIYCPRLSLTYFILGIPCGVYIGYLCFYTNHSGITCLVIQRSKSLDTLNLAKSSWLEKCDHQIIVRYNRTDCKIQPTTLDGLVSISSASAWGALCQALHLVPSSSAWVIIVPDTVMVFMDSLRRYVAPKSCIEMVYAGHSVDSYLGPYNALSAGVLLSYATLKKLKMQFPDKQSCQMDGKFWNNEDVLLGARIGRLGASIEDTRDIYGRSRFNGYNMNTMLNGGPLFRRSDYYKKSKFPIKVGMDCCSNELITIGTSDADQARWQYFLAHKIKTSRRPAVVTSRAGDGRRGDEAWKTALRDLGYNGSFSNITSQQYYDIWSRHISPELLAAKLASINTS